MSTVIWADTNAHNHADTASRGPGRPLQLGAHKELAPTPSSPTYDDTHLNNPGPPPDFPNVGGIVEMSVAVLGALAVPD